MPAIPGTRGFYDGNLTSPVEVEGSGVITIDPETTAMIIKRRYAVLKANYLPPVPGFNPFADYQYGNAFFIDEKVERNSGALTWFNRTFATVPPARTDRRLMTFTFPGQSSIKTSAVSGNVIGWNPYGIAPPKTRLVACQIAYSYAYQPAFGVDPLSLFPVLATWTITQITFQGKQVDFVGPVYASTGTAYIGSNRTETTWASQGTTTPAAAPSSWNLTPELTRWMGPIWQLALPSVPSLSIA